MSDSVDDFPEMLSSLKMLCESAWKDADINAVKVDRWLKNFKGACLSTQEERLHAFHLLVQLIYFGQKEIDECLRVLFQEQVAYPFVQAGLKRGLDKRCLETMLVAHLRENVRFVGVGQPSESGHAFLYPFRKANGLPTEVFSTIEELQKSFIGSRCTKGVSKPKRQIIYLDDFCATGEQVARREGDKINELRRLNSRAQIDYFILFATSRAIDNLRRANLFDRVEAAIVFDDDYRVFNSSSQFYRSTPDGVDKTKAEMMMRIYGESIYSRRDALGYRDSQMLVSFRHNTPDNTLPVIWVDHASEPWHHIFPRAQKYDAFEV